MSGEASQTYQVVDGGSSNQVDEVHGHLDGKDNGEDRRHFAYFYPVDTRRALNGRALDRCDAGGEAVGVGRSCRRRG